MNKISFEIKRKFKKNGVFIGTYGDDTITHEKFILTNTTANVNIGDILTTIKTNNNLSSEVPFHHRKLHVVDIVPTESPSVSNQLKIYYETDWKVKKQSKQFRHDWLVAVFSTLTSLLTGAIAGVLASIIYNLILQK